MQKTDSNGNAGGVPPSKFALIIEAGKDFIKDSFKTIFWVIAALILLAFGMPSKYFKDPSMILDDFDEFRNVENIPVRFSIHDIETSDTLQNVTFIDLTNNKPIKLKLENGVYIGKIKGDKNKRNIPIAAQAGGYTSDTMKFTFNKITGYAAPNSPYMKKAIDEIRDSIQNIKDEALNN